MTLLNELIASIPDTSSSLTEALLKTKVLLHQLGRSDLAEWVTWELQGYPSTDAVPDYRQLNAAVRGTVSNGYIRHLDAQLPTMHLSSDVRSRFEKVRSTQSVSALEKLAGSDTEGMQQPIAPEFNGQFAQKLSAGFYIEAAWSSIGYGQVSQLLTQVRSRLLDFLLELQSKVGDEMTSKEMKELGQSEETGKMFNHAIFGDNATIMVGHGGAQTVVTGVQRGDVESLIRALVEKRVPSEDAAELRLAIEADSTSSGVTARTKGPKVSQWIGKMMTKAANASWNVELSIAANLLTDALNRYYG